MKDRLTASQQLLVHRVRTLALLPPLLAVLGGAACESSGHSDRAASRRRPRFARAEPHAVPDRGYDVEHYALELTVLPDERRIEGDCTVRLVSTADRLATVELDLVGLTVSGVTDANGAALAFTHEGSLLAVELPVPVAGDESVELVVSYGGTPVTGLWFSGRSLYDDEPTQVFSHGQAENSQGWFPCFDHPSDRATSEIRVTMPGDWVALAPGERIDLVEGKSWRTEHWRMSVPHPAYLMSLVAGELVVHEGSWNGIPLYFACEPVYEDWLEASFLETDEILAFLSEYTGLRYPYPKYSQATVANFPWGGMENVSATTLTPLTLDDERGHRDETSMTLVAHEAAHQWFGNLLTCADWSHIWLNEGFATYMELLYVEETRGVDEFRARMRDVQERYLLEDRRENRRPTVTNVWKDPEDLMDTRAYEGAAARLHLLRFVLGDDLFRAGVRTYAAENAGRGVVTEDLRQALEKVSGRDLSTFFEQWLFSPGYPEFELAWSWDRDDGEVTLEVKQVQSPLDGTPAAFEVPVEIVVLGDTGVARHRVEIDEERETFRFPASGRPFYVRFDEHGWIPKTVKWERATAEWLAIAHTDEDVNGRRDAVRALGHLAAAMRNGNDLQRRDTYAAELADRLRRDESAWVRAEAAEGLGRARGDEARQALALAAAEDDSAKVRVAALNALEEWGEDPALADFARAIFEEGYSWATMGAAAGLVSSADPGGAFDWIVEKLFIDSPHDQLCGLLLYHLGGLEDRRVLEELQRWADDTAVHPTARAVALDRLSRQQRDRVRISRFVAEHLDEENFRLRRAAVEALARLDDADARSALQAYYSQARTSNERRAIEAALDGRRLR